MIKKKDTMSFLDLEKLYLELFNKYKSKDGYGDKEVLLERTISFHMGEDNYERYLHTRNKRSCDNCQFLTDYSRNKGSQSFCSIFPIATDDIGYCSKFELRDNNNN